MVKKKKAFIFSYNTFPGFGANRLQGGSQKHSVLRRLGLMSEGLLRLKDEYSVVKADAPRWP